ncbi:MAG: sugar MFS transporter [Reichenbachiella sp.]|uniref:sugar MFS transporter n=1 Tax=Reichenbachiella sp. TaxID=2184521 RepID=UPI003297B8F3
MALGTINTPPTPTASAEAQRDYTPALITLTTLFFMWGFMTVMNDILIPHLRNIFELDFFRSMLIQTAFFGAYFVGSVIYFIISFKSGDPINKIGYKNGIILGLLISATGSAMFYPATFINAYWFYLFALFVLGLGFTVLQIAANPYVAILGTPQTASSRLNLAQGFNSLGTTLGPIIGGVLIFKFFAGPDAVKVPYLMMSGMLILLAVVIKLAKLPEFTNEETIERGRGALKFPNLTLGMIAIFMYVGGEVSIGSILVNYFGLSHIAGMEEHVASGYLSLYWGGLMIGRFSGAIYLSEINQQAKKMGLMTLVALSAFGVIYLANYLQGGMALLEILPLLLFVAIAFVLFILGRSIASRTLYLFALLSIGLLMITIFGSGPLAFWSVIGIGLFNSIMWSNIFTLAIDGLGKYTSQGSSLLVMMILGGAIVPPVQGLLADYLGIQLSFIVPVFCYLYIFYYGFSGYKSTSK